jgi:hypothetical protein
MYLDEPGVYIDHAARHVPEGMAKEAGFPVERLARAKRMKTEMAKANALIADQFKASGDVEVHAEAYGYRVLLYPDNGMAKLEKDGESYTPTPIPLSMAMVMFDSFVKDAKREEGSGAEQGQDQSPKAAPTPPPSPKAASGATKGAAAMLK